MSVTEGLEKDVRAVRKPGGVVLVFMPALIAVIGLAAIILAHLPAPGTAVASGYGIDELITGAIEPSGSPTAP
jgi:hypothetical protein